jgi:hypothetical protein
MMGVVKRGCLPRECGLTDYVRQSRLLSEIYGRVAVRHQMVHSWLRGAFSEFYQPQRGKFRHAF